MLTEGNYVLTGTITEFNQACLEAFNKCYKKGFRKGFLIGMIGCVGGFYLIADYDKWKKNKKAEEEKGTEI